MLYVNDLNDPHHCVFVFKYVNGIIDLKFDTKRLSDIHSYNTRGKSNFYLLRVSHNIMKTTSLPGSLIFLAPRDGKMRDLGNEVATKTAPFISRNSRMEQS